MTRKIYIIDNKPKQIEKLETLFVGEAETIPMVCSEPSDTDINTKVDELIEIIKGLENDVEIKILVDLCLIESERGTISTWDANRLTGVKFLRLFEDKRKANGINKNITTFICSVHTRPGGDGAKDIRNAIVGNDIDTTFLSVLDKPIDPTVEDNPKLKTGSYMCKQYVDYLDDDKASDIKTEAFHNVVLYGHKK